MSTINKREKRIARNCYLHAINEADPSGYPDIQIASADWTKSAATRIVGAKRYEGKNY